MKRRWIQVLLVIVGFLVVSGHLVAFAFLGMTTSNWLSGTVIGLLLAVFGGAHLLLASAAGASTQMRWQQVAYGLIALIIGIGEGLLGVRANSAGWWLLVPWLITALAIGMLVAGPPAEKAGRLGMFGFTSGLIYASGTRGIEGMSGLISALVWALLLGAGAIGVGAVAHSVVSRVHRPALGN